VSPRQTPEKGLLQILPHLEDAADTPALIRSRSIQSEGYVIGYEGKSWEAASFPRLGIEDPESLFLTAIRSGALPIRGRIKGHESKNAAAFLEGLFETFPKACRKPFITPLSKLWTRWKQKNDADATTFGRGIGRRLREEYEEGIAGGLSEYLLDERLHLRDVRTYLRMRGWLLGWTEHLSRREDWASRECANILTRNLSSILMRAQHNANPNYAAQAANSLPGMLSALEEGIERLRKSDPESAHLLRKNRQTIITYALHSGYFDFPIKVVLNFPGALRRFHEQIGHLERVSPDDAHRLRSRIDSLAYRMLTNGRLDLE